MKRHELFDALGNEKRLEIIRILLSEEVSVGELASILGMSQSALSQHLGIMRGYGLVNTRRDGQNIYYSCNDPAARAVVAIADAYIAEPGEPRRLRKG